MSDTTDTAAPDAASPEQASDAGPLPDPAAATDAQGDNGNEESEVDGSTSEAAKYRRKLRTVEKERDELSTVVDALRRAEVSRLATSGDGVRLHDAADVFPAGCDLADVLGDDGTVDPGKVVAAIEARTAGRAHLRADLAPGPRTPKPDMSQGSGRGAVSGTGAAWADVIRGR